MMKRCNLKKKATNEFKCVSWPFYRFWQSINFYIYPTNIQKTINLNFKWGNYFFVQLKNRIALEERLVGFKYSNNKIDSFFIHSLLNRLYFIITLHSYCLFLLHDSNSMRATVVRCKNKLPLHQTVKGEFIVLFCNFYLLVNTIYQVELRDEFPHVSWRWIEFVVKNIWNCQNAQKHQREKSLSIYAVDGSMAYRCKNKIEGKTCICPFFYSFWNLRNDQCQHTCNFKNDQCVSKIFGVT